MKKLLISFLFAFAVLFTIQAAGVTAHYTVIGGSSGQLSDSTPYITVSKNSSGSAKATIYITINDPQGKKWTWSANGDASVTPFVEDGTTVVVEYGGSYNNNPISVRSTDGSYSATFYIRY